jgi:hypothetical protein
MFNGLRGNPFYGHHLGRLSKYNIQDLFEFIDIRKDQVIDIHEWLESFRKIDVLDFLTFLTFSTNPNKTCPGLYDLKNISTSQHFTSPKSSK